MTTPTTHDSEDTVFIKEKGAWKEIPEDEFSLYRIVCPLSRELLQQFKSRTPQPMVVHLARTQSLREYPCNVCHVDVFDDCVLIEDSHSPPTPITLPTTLPMNLSPIVSSLPCQQQDDDNEPPPFLLQESHLQLPSIPLTIPPPEKEDDHDLPTPILITTNLLMDEEQPQPLPQPEEEEEPPQRPIYPSPSQSIISPSVVPEGIDELCQEIHNQLSQLEGMDTKWTLFCGKNFLKFTHHEVDFHTVMLETLSVSELSDLLRCCFHPTIQIKNLPLKAYNALKSRNKNTLIHYIRSVKKLKTS